MRARNIKPGLWKDEELATLPMEARYLFPGLWCMADAKGRLEDRPRWIKSEIFPYDDSIGAARVSQLLQLLHDGRFIQRYGAGRDAYIQIVNFEKHQNPHKQERDKGTQIPDPPVFDDQPTTKIEKKSAFNGTTSEKNGTTSEVTPVENGSAPDDCGLRIADTGLMNAECGESKPAVLSFPAPTQARSSVSSRWAQFKHRWIEITESNVKIEDAARSWVSLVTPDVEDKVFECLESYAKSKQVADRVFYNPDNWLWEQARNKWETVWPKAREPTPSPQELRRADVVAGMELIDQIRRS